MAFDEKLTDKRTIKRNLRKGLVKSGDLDKHLQDLPDLSDAIYVASPEPAEGAESTGDTPPE